MVLSPFRRFLSLVVLLGGAAALFATRPSFTGASAGLSVDANTATCLSNLNQISRAYALYARDYDGKIPHGVDPEDHFNPQIWTGAYGGRFYNDAKNGLLLHQILRPYVASPQVFHCPADVGWTQSRLPFNDGSSLRDVHPTAFDKYGTSYLIWTKYGFLLNTAADLDNPAETVLLFDGDMWHSNAGRELINGLFADGHAQNLTAQQFMAYSPYSDE